MFETLKQNNLQGHHLINTSSRTVAMVENEIFATEMKDNLIYLIQCILNYFSNILLRFLDMLNWSQNMQRYNYVYLNRHAHKG